MKKTLIVPVLLLATTPFVVGCTKKPTDLPPPPPVTGTTETVTPVVNPVQTGTTETMAPVMTGTMTPTVTPVQTGTMTPAVPVTVTRTETLTYASPAGPQDPVEFSVTVTDGTITAASATAKSTNDISKQLQTAFAGEVAAKVIGKKAKDLDVDAIGAASLTTAAFETFVHSF